MCVLCQVALGKTQVDKDGSSDGLKKGFDSLKYVGTEEPNPAQDLLLPSGKKEWYRKISLAKRGRQMLHNAYQKGLRKVQMHIAHLCVTSFRC